MEYLLLIVAISFFAGAICCHYFWKWYQSAVIKDKLKELREAKVTAQFNMGGGISYCRPFRLGITQDGYDGNLSGFNEVRIIRHEKLIELYGSWNKNGKNQIDPFSFCLPTGIDTVDPDNLVKFGQYFVDVGTELNKKFNIEQQ